MEMEMGMDNETIYTPEGRQAITPLLALHDAAAASDFYAEAFGAVERSRMTDPQGKIAHADLSIGPAVFMLADEYAEHNRSPRQLGGSSVILYVYVPDADAAAARAVRLGARLLRPIADQPHGDRVAKIEDPFGHVWMLATPLQGGRPT
jgi:PhnB protein